MLVHLTKNLMAQVTFNLVYAGLAIFILVVGLVGVAIKNDFLFLMYQAFLILSVFKYFYFHWQYSMSDLMQQ